MEKVTYKDVDDYIQQASPESRPYLVELRRLVVENAPEAVEGISYQLPAYKYLGRPLVYFGAFKSHVSLFATASKRIAENFKDELKGYAQSKGTIQFKLGQALPADLIGRLVRERVLENEEMAKTSRPRKAKEG